MVGLLAAAVPVLAAQYVIQGEEIKPSADWTDKAGAGGDVSNASLPVADGSASPGAGYPFGGALNVYDAIDPGTGAWLRTTQSAGALRPDAATPGSATVVFRLKTADASSAGFAGTTYSRAIVLTFSSISGDSAHPKRGPAVAFRPDKLAIVSTTSAVLGGGEVTGIDNTGWHVYHLIGRDNGNKVDLYRDGVLILSDINNNSSGESSIQGTPGIDALSIGSSPSSARTDYFLDWIGYKDGIDPLWMPIEPVPEPGSLLVLCTGMLGLLKLRRKA